MNLSLSRILEQIDSYEDDYIVACRELRAKAVAVFGATTDEELAAALKEALDTEYELVGDCELFSELGEQLGMDSESD